MRRRYVLIGFALLCMLTLALPAMGAPSPFSLAKAALERAQKADRTAHRANRTGHKAVSVAKQARRRSGKALVSARRAGRKASRAAAKAGVTGPTGPAGAAGTARAYGLIASNGTLDATHSKNVAAVTHTVGTGSYCIALAPGVDPGVSGVVASPDFSDTTTGPLIQWDSKDGAGCPAGQMDIETRQLLANNPGTPLVEDAKDEGFFFVVP